VLAPLSPQAVKARTIEALVQLALHGARRRPLVLEIENLHWSDPSSEEVFTALVERLAGARILLLLTYRPGYQPLWITKSYATQLSLAPLAPRESRRVVQAVVRTGGMPEAVVQAILARAGGNPFFLEELSRTAIEQDDSHRTVQVPTTIQAVLAARIDRLPPEAKHVLQVAAVIGKDVAVPLLAAIARVSEDVLQRGLAHLQAVELLYERTRAVDRAVTFKHVLIQEAVYQSLLQSTRRQYHQRIAQVLEAQFPEKCETQPELLAHHYTEAGFKEQAIAYWQRAGQQAVQRSAHVEAISHLTTALVLLLTLPDTPKRTQQELVLQTSLGPALMDSKGFAAPEVEHVYARARELCRQIGDTPQLFPVLRGLWVFYFVGGKHETARELAEQLLTLAQDYHAPDLLLEAFRAMGCTLFYLGEFVSARAHLEQGIALYDPQQHRSHAFLYGEDPGVGCRAFAARALWCLGYPDQALQRSREALTLAQELAQPFSLTQAQSFAAWLHQFRREGLLTQQQAEAAMTSATELGFPAWLGHGLILHGWASAAQGQGAEGIAQIHQGLSTRQTTGADLARPYWLALLAEVYGEAGQAEEGLSVLSEAFIVVRRNGERWWEAELYRLKGELLLRQAAGLSAVPEAERLLTTEAEAAFRQALEIARRQHAKSLDLRAAMSLARLWQRQGKRADAYDLLAPIYGWFTEGFDTADLQEAKALLDALAVVHASPAA
jgi:predicted ATPase